MALRIGELLIQKKLLTQEQLESALVAQGHSGKFLGEILVEKGFILETDLLKVLAEQFNTHFVSLEQVQINPVAVKQVPVDLVAEHYFMPIEMRNGVMLIAVSNPLDMWPMSTLQKQLNLEDVQIVLALKEDIKNCIRKYYA